MGATPDHWRAAGRRDYR